ncbi:MAG: hypothetical protein JRG91_14580 [Deltaproteobacteria bacterium]|nr:hypothetical protein [Deltaproteobacteria bacterium]
MLLCCILGAPACALNFGTDPVGAPDAWGDPDAVDAAEAADDLLDAPLDGEAFEDVLDGDVVEEDPYNPFEPIPKVSEDLLTFVRALPIVSDPSTFSTPGTTRRSNWVGLLDHILSGEYDEAATEARTLNLELRVVDDSVSGRPFIVLWDASRAEGIYVFDPFPVNPLIIEVPYPMSDSGTLDEGVEILRQVPGWVLAVAGATRCTMTTTVSCDGTTLSCSSSPASFRISDVAHSTALVFHLVHRFLDDRDSSAITLQLQGQADATGARVIISDGTALQDVSSISVLLRNSLSDALRPGFPSYADSVRSCNAPADVGTFTSDCNATNVQGRWTNGSLDPCNTPASAPTDRFLALELDSAMRASEVFDAVAAALATLFE